MDKMSKNYMYHYCLGIKFTVQEHAKYTRRMEEGFDLPDARYDQWLQIYHPEDGNLIVVVESGGQRSALVLDADTQ